MIKVTCDRCGKEMDYSCVSNALCDYDQKAWRPSVFINGVDPESGKPRLFQLCEECEEDLYRFIFDDGVTENEQTDKITNSNSNA